MSYQVLARKWRPKKFEDVIGQGAIIRSIQQALKNNRVGHAYLLTGTRGIGKTTVARLMAQALRCESRDTHENPCGSCAACLDFTSGQSMNVIEIDGASNNGVDNIRELIGHVDYLPTTGHKKIYIIDEVHMLSNQAFNALLKTLEEPPSHVVFILATTEPQKLLGTVLSRCQRLDFRNASVKDLTELIKKISKAENITFQDDDYITDIAELGKGSMRDTLSLLDQVLIYADNNVVNEEVLTNALGIAKKSLLKNMSVGLLQGNCEILSHELNEAKELNIETQNLAKALLNHLFKISEIIDSPKVLEARGFCTADSINDISMPELMWIFENLAHDVTWIFDTPDSDIVFHMILKKIALRRQYFSHQKKNPEIIVTQKNETIETPIAKKQKNWDDFINFLRSEVPTFALNLEQGNLVSDVNVEANELNIQVGFKKTETIFCDYLKNENEFQKLRTLISEFFKKDKINLELMIIDLEDRDFKNMAEVEADKLSHKREQKIETIKKHPMIVKTAEILNAKIHKIILNEDE